MTAVRTDPIKHSTSVEWAVGATWLLALLAAALASVGVLIAAGSAIEPLTADPLTVSITTAEPLHAVGHNSYSGAPYVADRSTITATRVTAQVSGLAPATRVGLAFGPLAWQLTGATVAGSLALAFARLRRPRSDPRRAARPFIAAGVITAVGTSVGQILDELARTGLHGVMWHGSAGVGALGSGSGDFTFQFGWLAIALGAVAIAAVLARRDHDTGDALD